MSCSDETLLKQDQINEIGSRLSHFIRKEFDQLIKHLRAIDVVDVGVELGHDILDAAGSLENQ